MVRQFRPSWSQVLAARFRTWPDVAARSAAALGVLLAVPVLYVAVYAPLSAPEISPRTGSVVGWEPVRTGPAQRQDIWHIRLDGRDGPVAVDGRGTPRDQQVASAICVRESVTKAPVGNVHRSFIAHPGPC